MSDSKFEHPAGIPDALFTSEMVGESIDMSTLPLDEQRAIMGFAVQDIADDGPEDRGTFVITAYVPATTITHTNGPMSRETIRHWRIRRRATKQRMRQTRKRRRGYA
jgi:hypothetical protein